MDFWHDDPRDVIDTHPQNFQNSQNSTKKETSGKDGKASEPGVLQNQKDGKKAKPGKLRAMFNYSDRL